MKKSLLILLALSMNLLCSANVAENDTMPSTLKEPILLKHDSLMNAYGDSRADTFALASEYDAAPISPILKEFMTNDEYADGQAFYLDGGKTYYLDGNDSISKGFTLRTNPEDAAIGLRAKVICGIGKNIDFYPYTSYYYDNPEGEQWRGWFNAFMLGRQTKTLVNDEIHIKKIAFNDIDFDNPKALNIGDDYAGMGTPSNNCFINMYTYGMNIVLDSLVIDNCTFKRFVHGFIYEQGEYYKIWNHVLIQNNLFFDCGFYEYDRGGYPWIAGTGLNSATNLFKDMKVISNTFYDSPLSALFSEQFFGMRWTNGPWNITFSNNTLINFNTHANGAIFKMHAIPDSSVYNVENNLILLTKQDGDKRELGSWGAYIVETQYLHDDSYGHVTLNFNNNWSTNNNLTNGQIFSDRPWSSTNRSFGTLVNNGCATLNGSLEVKAANISATDLFISPNPPHKAESTYEQNMHRADALDGTAQEYNVNLYYKDFNNDIVANKVGDQRWNNQQYANSVNGVRIVNNPSEAQAYNLAGQRVGKGYKGIVVVKGRKYIQK